MRIISGTYKGRIIMGYDIFGTRPTMDRVKESLFAMLGFSVKGAACLDLFAGSGALGIEALSNGAKSCVFVDQNPKVIATLKENLEKINVQEDYQLMRADYKEALKSLALQSHQFDLVFLDPPYQDQRMESSINLLKEYHLLSEHAILVCESEGEEYDSPYPLWKEKQYGSKVVKLFRIK